MTKLAGGSVFLGILALILALFYIQPKVEAKANFTANETQENLQETFIQTNNQPNQTIRQQELPAQTPPQETIEESETESTMFSETQSFRATAYCLKGRTATGGGVRRGIVAADAHVLPLGSRIQVDAGSYSGTYMVADTGGSVRGHVLDIWVPSCSEAARFGRKSVKVSMMKRKRNS